MGGSFIGTTAVAYMQHLRTCLTTSLVSYLFQLDLVLIYAASRQYAEPQLGFRYILRARDKLLYVK